MELEVFVHGAICMAYSGRCLMSQYLTNRDANQGICAQSCRWKYKTFIEEELRPGELMEIQEDDNGSYILNARDLCAIEFLKDLRDAGVSGFKVEGRSKTIYYLSTVAKTYRRAIDDMIAGKKFDPQLINELKKTANRGFSPGFLTGKFTDQDIYYDKNKPIQTHKFIGVVRAHKTVGSKVLIEVEVRNRIEKGSEVEILTPDKSYITKIKGMFDLEMNEIDDAHGGASNKIFEMEKDVPVGSIIRQEIS
jgi:putative protease